MKKQHRIFLIALLAIIGLICASSAGLAVQANPDPFLFKQPNGATISVWQFGDEFLHWSEDAAGNLIVFDEAQNGFCYATWSDEGEVSTGQLVGAGLPLAMVRNSAARHTIPQKVIAKAEETRATLTEGLFDEEAFVQAITTAMAAPVGTAPQYADVEKMKRKMLMIHVTFADRSNILTRNGDVMPKMSGQQIYDLCFGLRGQVDRSVNGYYQDILMTDEVVITPAEVLVPLDGCQGVIEVVLPGRHPNYAADDPLSAAAMRTAMAQACDEGLINLVPFDTNGDGTLATAELAIGMIFDGFEYSMGRIVPNFWGVSIGSGSTPAANLTQGVKIASLFAQGAFHRNSGDVYDDAGTPGVIVHEMGHSGYSFQDTYDTGSLSASSGGLGYWSMQASGDNGRLPGEYAGQTSGYQCAYNLVRSGFVIPGTLAYGETAVMDNHLDIYLMQTPVVTPVENTPVTNYFGVQYRGQYFLLQQRKYGDTFNYDQGAFAYISSNTNTPVDASIGGMLIQHVDLNVPTNRISNKPGHYRAAYEEAHGGVQSMQQRSGTPGRAGEFSDLWGVTKSEFSYRSDPGTGIYAYDDGRVWVNALTPVPNQNTPSGVALTEINWDPATLTTSFMNGFRPEIDVQPQSATAVAGLAHDLKVEATSLDGGDLSYQWYKDGLPIAGATAATYAAVNNIPGFYDYYVVVTNTVTDPLDGQRRFTTATSDTATLEVFTHYNVYMQPAKPFLYVDDTLVVDIMMDGDINYSQFMAEIAFDPALLKYDGYENLAGWVAACAPSAAGKITVRVVPTMNAVTGEPCDDIKIVTLKFKVQEGFSGDDVDTALSFASLSVFPAGGYVGAGLAYGKDAPITVTECTILSTVDYLSNQIGQRIYGTPNELAAAEYAVAQMAKNDAFTAQVVEVPLLRENGILWGGDKQESAFVELTEGFGISGRAYPNTASFGGFEGLFHDFGVYGETLSLPDAAEVAAAGGKVYGALRFGSSAPTVALITTAVSQITAGLPAGTQVTGLFIARSSTAAGTVQYAVPSVSGTFTATTPSVATMSLRHLEKVVAAGESGKIKEVRRIDPYISWNAMATKPASTPNPDLVITVIAHMDTVLASPGASDNASGVATVVELARLFQDVDLGNIELILAGVGSEEYADFDGARVICEQLVAEGKDGVAIDFCCDTETAGPGAVNTRGELIENYAFGIWMGSTGNNNRAPVFNLSAFLGSTYAADVPWPADIKNVKIFSYGSSEQMMFNLYGMDACRPVFGADVSYTGTTNTLVYGNKYHTSQDTMEENYRYDLNKMAVQVIENAILKAAELKVTKRVQAELDSTLREVTLTNAAQLFNVYTWVELSFGTETLRFEKGGPTTLALPTAVQNFVITAASAGGVGIADHQNATMNEQYKNFITSMLAELTIK